MLQKSKMGYFAVNANANPKKCQKNKKSLTHFTASNLLYL